MVICCAGELIAVDYLYSQTGQVLHMTVPEPDEAVDEDQLVEDMPLDEGFVDVSVDVEDLTVNIFDETAPSPSQAITPPVAELPGQTAPSASPVSIVPCCHMSDLT